MFISLTADYVGIVKEKWSVCEVCRDDFFWIKRNGSANKLSDCTKKAHAKAQRRKGFVGAVLVVVYDNRINY